MSFQAVFGANGEAKAQPSTDLENHIISTAKGKDKNLNEIIRDVEISKPYDVEHKLKVRYDEDKLRYSGLPEGWVLEAHRQFGVPLTAVPRTDVKGYPDRIPIVLLKLRQRFVELSGLTVEGVFRLAPDGQDVTDVKFSINTGQALASLEKTKDPHVVANLIKQFFRELKPKILCSMSKEEIVEAASVTDMEKIGIIVERLPDANKAVFMWLLDLLADVAANSNVNRMTATNLAIVLSPNLYDAGPDIEPIEELMLSQKVAALCSGCLKWRIMDRSKKQDNDRPFSQEIPPPPPPESDGEE